MHEPAEKKTPAQAYSAARQAREISPPEIKQLAVSAIPRGGTVYMMEVLRKAGVSVGHESRGMHGIVSGLDFDPARYDVHIHQLREPAATCASLRIEPTIMLDLWSWIGERPPEYLPENERLAWTYVRWHRRWIDKRPTLIYRVEQIHEVWPSILRLAGIDDSIPLPDLSRHTNRRAEKVRTRRGYRPLENFGEGAWGRAAIELYEVGG